MFSRALNLTQFSKLNVVIWSTLAFQAGGINAGGFLACHRFVTHTTGFATHFGAEFALGHFDTAVGMLTVPLFFLIGSMFSGLLVDHRILAGKRPHYNFLFATVAGVLYLTAFLGGGGTLAVFGTPINISKDFSILVLLCLASGMQNAAITSASGAVIRTTHLTGLTTDLGIGFVRVLTHWRKGQSGYLEMRNNMARMSIIFSFLVGSTFAAFLFYHAHYWGFMLPALIATSLALFGYYLDRKELAAQISHFANLNKGILNRVRKPKG